MNDPLADVLALAGRAFDEARSGAVHVSSTELLDQIADTQRALNALSAVQAVRISQFAARGQVHDGESGVWVERDFGVGHVAEFTGTEVGPLLGLSPGSADRRVEVAAALARKLPATLAAMAAGDLDWWRASVIAGELRDASPQTCAAVEEIVHPKVCGDAPRAVRARVRRALLRVDEDALREKAAKARLERGVRQWASDLPGMTEWAVTLPAADAARCWAAVDELAHQRRRDDTSVSLEQARADALVDLLLGQADVSTTVTFLLPVQRDFHPVAGDTGVDEETAELLAREDGSDWADVVDLFDRTDPADLDAALEATGSDADVIDTAPDATARAGVVAGVRHGCPGGPGGSGFTPTGPVGAGILHPADETTAPAAPVTASTPGWLRVGPAGQEIPGVGVIPADVVTQIASRFDTRITRALFDPATGTILETRTSKYRPPKKMAALIELRDGTCRFPGCTMPAKRCELDHVIPWPRGHTEPANLHCLCRHHHRAKHEAGWRLTMTLDGVCTWTSPVGQHYVTHPVDHRQRSA